MERDNYANVYDVRWREKHYEVKDEVIVDEAPPTYETGEIKFRQNKRKSKVKGLFKGLAFLLIASVSGAASGAYIVEKKLSGIDPSNYAERYRIPNVTYGENDVIPKNSINRVVELVGPSVVGISNKAENFLGQIADRYSGSGVIIDGEKGYIVTNYHIISGTEEIVVKLSGGNAKPLTAKLVGFDEASDIALIKVEEVNLTAARLGDSSRVKPGDTVIAMGNPLGEEFVGTVTSGILTSTSKRIQGKDDVNREKTVYKVLQTNAEITNGNNGGPICNEYGEVIGISNFKIEDADGMGYALPIKEVVQIIESLINEGKVVRPSFGIEGGTFSDNNYGIQGVYVGPVYVGSGAWEAGIRTSDVIVEIDGAKITRYEDYLSAIEKHKVGDIVNCRIFRYSDGKVYEKKVTLKKNK